MTLRKNLWRMKTPRNEDPKEEPIEDEEPKEEPMEKDDPKG